MGVGGCYQIRETYIPLPAHSVSIKGLRETASLLSIIYLIKTHHIVCPQKVIQVLCPLKVVCAGKISKNYKAFAFQLDAGDMAKMLPTPVLLNRIYIHS